MTKGKAADIIHIKKKSLDDYLMFLRLGISMNFDFVNYIQIPFNNLRRYIKSHKNRVHWNPEIHDDVESLLKYVEDSNQNLKNEELK